MSQTTVLMVLDGYGLTDTKIGNAIKQANTPVMDKLMKDYPMQEGQASGLAVGLPEGQMGNSEVGHLNLGAGRTVYQELTRITKSIQDEDFFTNKEFLSAVENVKNGGENAALHVMGLLSDGGVHSHNSHLYGVLELAKRNNIKNVYIHAFMDGRDTAPTSGLGFIKDLEAKIKEIGVGEIATISGRFYAMDRDNRWDRVEKAYNAVMFNDGVKCANAEECINNSYSNDINDEFVVPSVIAENSNIKEGDSVIFANFRPDRARELTRAICNVDFDGFERAKGHIPVKFVSFTEYDITITNKSVAFKAEAITNTLGEYLSNLGKNQLRIAETEKYAHVTFFFNGGVEEPYKNEDRALVSSPDVLTYDMKPEMSAYEVTDELVPKIKSGKYDFVLVNFANPDMVGHTGNIDATVKAIETVDTCVEKVYNAIMEVNGQMFICADHGNADKLLDYDTNEPFTAHTTNPVPFILINGKDANGNDVKDIRKDGKLCDVAPTILELMGLEVPKEMTGTSLIVK